MRPHLTMAGIPPSFQSCPAPSPAAEVGNEAQSIESLMRPVAAPGHYAPWIAPPRAGIDNKPGDFEYVRMAE